MRISIARMMAAFAAVLVLSLAALSPAAAQTEISVSNSSGCTLFLTLVDGGGNLTGPYTIPSGGTGTSITVPNGYVATGVEDINGRTRRFSGAPEPGCTACIPLPAQGSDVCCAIVCYNAAAGTITISSCPSCQ